MLVASKMARLAGEMRAARSGLAVISPHLDDAILSCGAFMAHLAGRCPVTVVTVFTAASPHRWSVSARRQMRSSGMSDPERFFEQRRAEDRTVLAELGATAVHLGLPDALFRRVRAAPGGMPGTAGRPAYPVFRFDAARGRIAPADAGLDAEVAGRLTAVAGVAGARLILAPLGVGRHVDHLIARAAARRLGQRVVYYSDFPYALGAAPDPGFVRRASLAPEPWLHGRAANAARIAGYQTQFRGLFPDGVVPTRPEAYWLATSDSANEA